MSASSEGHPNLSFPYTSDDWAGLPVHIVHTRPHSEPVYLSWLTPTDPAKVAHSRSHSLSPSALGRRRGYSHYSPAAPLVSFSDISRLSLGPGALSSDQFWALPAPLFDSAVHDWSQPTEPDPDPDPVSTSSTKSSSSLSLAPARPPPPLDPGPEVLPSRSIHPPRPLRGLAPASSLPLSGSEDTSDKGLTALPISGGGGPWFPSSQLPDFAPGARDSQFSFTSQTAPPPTHLASPLRDLPTYSLSTDHPHPHHYQQSQPQPLPQHLLTGPSVTGGHLGTDPPPHPLLQLPFPLTQPSTTTTTQKMSPVTVGAHPPHQAQRVVSYPTMADPVVANLQYQLLALQLELVQCKERQAQELLQRERRLSQIMNHYYREKRPAGPSKSGDSVAYVSSILEDVIAAYENRLAAVSTESRGSPPPVVTHPLDLDPFRTHYRPPPSSGNRPTQSQAPTPTPTPAPASQPTPSPLPYPPKLEGSPPPGRNPEVEALRRENELLQLQLLAFNQAQPRWRTSGGPASDPQQANNKARLTRAFIHQDKLYWKYQLWKVDDLDEDECRSLIKEFMLLFKVNDPRHLMTWLSLRRHKSDAKRPPRSRDQNPARVEPREA
ncbi:hypothetical protein BJ085DRAFT_35741 [Dimargaris cristalligena]|uniref:Uncharacterized protein n=1 Tax=Dimargaris cristalligena TaxID=215637 RepID=A0A4V1J4L9_9FUNG|nr:hypothetical protein BJ085DRAFT_35741 [Dimargaris cristalligena]|eukprot:RKP36019.1 hypothetical protein BJ085DRAFT_35741 [Dimargaris cristalligena]